MPAHTLEDRLESELESIVIGAQLMRQGKDSTPPLERLEWLEACVASAIELVRKIERRNHRRSKEG